MRTHTITADLTQTVTLDESRSVELEFTVIADMFYEPAQIWGLPEDSSPADGAFDLQSLKITEATEGGKPVHLNLGTMALLRGAINLERVEEQMWEAYQEKLAPSDEY